MVLLIFLVGALLGVLAGGTLYSEMSSSRPPAIPLPRANDEG
jgi:hypothetical protein